MQRTNEQASRRPPSQQHCPGTGHSPESAEQCWPSQTPHLHATPVAQHNSGTFSAILPATVGAGAASGGRTPGCGALGALSSKVWTCWCEPTGVEPPASLSVISRRRWMLVLRAKSPRWNDGMDGWNE
eukprot:351070-Chlamydomonas_euryale.AAC.2